MRTLSSSSDIPQNTAHAPVMIPIMSTYDDKSTRNLQLPHDGPVEIQECSANYATCTQCGDKLKQTMGSMNGMFVCITCQRLSNPVLDREMSEMFQQNNETHDGQRQTTLQNDSDIIAGVNTLSANDVYDDGCLEDDGELIAGNTLGEGEEAFEPNHVNATEFVSMASEDEIILGDDETDICGTIQ
eukprot:200366_1